KRGNDRRWMTEGRQQKTDDRGQITEGEGRRGEAERERKMVSQSWFGRKGLVRRRVQLASLFQKIAMVCLVTFCALVFCSHAMANTVSVSFDDVDSLGISVSGFQLFFHQPDSTYGWPVEYDGNQDPPDFGADFAYSWGPNVPYEGSYWGLDTLISSTGDVDYVRGIAPYADRFETWNKMTDGLVLTMGSENTSFAINVTDERNLFFDFQGDYGEIIPSLQITEAWSEGNQHITISGTAAVPIPSALILLGSGLIGLVGITRKGHSLAQ
ncbi:MAG: hypothetical protein SWE60_25705, partial [Thermodesulfobacteriota bacterium]|nr:hypothetical protein [Thermodesulfobacteriota bacterium]